MIFVVHVSHCIAHTQIFSVFSSSILFFNTLIIIIIIIYCINLRNHWVETRAHTQNLFFNVSYTFFEFLLCLRAKCCAPRTHNRLNNLKKYIKSRTVCCARFRRLYTSYYYYVYDIPYMANGARGSMLYIIIYLFLIVLYARANAICALANLDLVQFAANGVHTTRWVQ